MLTSKTFLTKTKRGNILKVVREHYLRDDLWCGSFFCKLCKHKDTELLLEKTPESISKLYDFPHYLLLDTNVVLHQMDVLDEDVLKNVIILQTVLEEVKHRSAAIYKRILEVVDNKKRRFYSFVNEHHQSTYVERLPGENINDRNDRAIRAAASWYDRHLASGRPSRIAPRVILLTDDESNRAKAEQEGIMACTVRQYIKSLTQFPALEDKIARNVAPESSVENALFPTHLPPAQIHMGIKNGKLYQGKFHASRENFLEGSASVQGFDKPILLQGHIGMNRSVDGDTVAIEIYPEEQWSKPSEIVLEDGAEDPGDQLDEEKILEKAKEQSRKDQEIQPTGRVVGIIRRKWRQYCGILLPSMLPGATRHLFVPAERKIPRVRIETRQSDVLISQRIVVALDSWPCNSRYPQGHFVRALGPIGDKNAENEVLLLEHDVPHARFSEAVLSCLPDKDWTIPPQELARRVDLRSVTVCSVDPPGCTDIDDALHARIKPGLPEGAPVRYEVGVHIADVTHFVRPETALDKEAAARSTTVYLVDRRIDMVPDLLSSNLCSLRGGEERLAFSCVWEVDENAHILATKFHKSVIKSASAMTYEEAQLAIDDQHRHDEVASSLRILNMLAKKLKKKRLDNGALLLASPEIRFQVDSETHDPIDVETKRIRDTNSMVEEFMLLANVSVAERLVSDFPQCALLRRHPPPVPTQFETFIKAARQQGFELDVTTNASLARSLDLAVKPEQPYFNTLLRIMATRCMQQAVYFCSGQLTQDQFYHYGLACPIYTHFTSPIRRYADVMVHRLLAATIGADSTFGNMLDTRHATCLSDNLNYRHRQAQLAGRASVALNTHLMFRGRVTVESGVVLYVRRNAIVVLVPRYGLEAPLMLPADKFSYNDEAQTQQCDDVILRTFDEITVQLSLDTTNVQHQRLRFSLVKPHIEGFSVVPEDAALRPDDDSDKSAGEGQAADVEMKETAAVEAKRKSQGESLPKGKKSKKKKKN